MGNMVVGSSENLAGLLLTGARQMPTFLPVAGQAWGQWMTKLST